MCNCPRSPEGSLLLVLRWLMYTEHSLVIALLLRFIVMITLDYTASHVKWYERQAVEFNEQSAP